MRLLSSRVLQGAYPARLNKLWDQFDGDKGTFETPMYTIDRQLQTASAATTRLQKSTFLLYVCLFFVFVFVLFFGG